jgi:xanthosine utilization system XapX-like protein
MGSRTLIWAVLAATVSYGFATAAMGSPPPAAASGEQVVVWFSENADTVRWMVWALTITGPLLAIVFALLRRVLPAPHGDIFLIGGVGIIVTTAVQSWTWAGLALHADRLEPATARTVLDVSLFWGPVLTGATITMMLPVTLLAVGGRSRLPRWLGILGVVAIVEQAVETVTIFGASGFAEPGGAMNLQLGAGLVWAWLLAFALWAGLRSEPAADVA